MTWTWRNKTADTHLSKLSAACHGIHFKNNLPTARPAFRSDASNHLTSSESAQRRTETNLALCVVTRCGAGALLLLFPVTIRCAFHKPGHDLLMHVFKKFMNWSRPEQRWSCSNHSSLSSFLWAHRERRAGWVQAFEGFFCSKRRYRRFKIKIKGGDLLLHSDR